MFTYYGNKTVSKELFRQRLIDSPPPVIAIDTETISLKEKLPIGFAIATAADEAWWFSCYPERDPEIDLLKPLLSNPNIKKVYANAMFDIRVQPLIIQDFPFDESNIVDILVMARLLGKTHARVTDLAAEIGREAQDAGDMLSEYGVKTMLELPHEMVAAKCANDAQVTLDLYNILAPQIDSLEGLSPDYMDVERKVVPILIDMSLRGIAIDQNDRAAMEKRLERERDYYKGICTQLDFSPGSGQQTGYILAKRGNFLPLTRSKKQLRTDADTLEFLDDPIAAVVLGFKHVNSILTKYIYPLRGLDRCYTEYGLDTEVGRTKSSDFNMQNIPSEKSKVRMDVRHIFYPDTGTFTTGDYCLAPETRVLTSDLRWKAIEDIEIGDSLVSIDEHTHLGKGKRRKLRYTTVEDHKYTVRHAYMIALSDGRSITASGEHPWLVVDNYGGHWQTTEQLRPGDQIRQLVEPWDEPEQDYELGYLAGSFDSEGWVDQHKSNIVGYAQKAGETQEKVESLLQSKLGFVLSTTEYDMSKYYEYKSVPLRNLKSIRISNQRDCIRFLGIVRPERLLKKFNLEGREPGDKGGRATVAAILDLEEMQVFVSIQTSTHTFVAEGLFTHNSQEHLRILMHFSGDKQMERVYYEHEMAGDIHEYYARKKGIPRRVAKVINYAIPYGASPQVIRAQTKIRSLQRCSDYLDDWFATFPDAAEWIRAAKEYGIRHGKSMPTLFGRQIAIPEEFNKWGKLNIDAMERKAVNYPILGSDGEVMKRALIICSDHKLPLAVQVHDSITCDGDIEFPVSELEAVASVNLPFVVEKTRRWK